MTLPRGATPFAQLADNTLKQPGCWLWLGTHDRGGYPRLSGGTRVSRFVLANKLGRELVDGEVCRHTCDNPECINPDHLIPGTMKDNTRDMHERGRANPPRGEDHHKTRLTTSDVVSIRAFVGTLQECAKRFGVSKTTIHNIRTGLTWRHI